jgi:2,5-dioxopentanoate dehydrogenase
MSSPLQSIDPRTGICGDTLRETTVPELEAMIAAAREAARSSEFSDARRRAVLLFEISERLRRRSSEIVAAAQGETGLPVGRLEGELERTCVQLEMFAGVIDSGEHFDVIIDNADAHARPVPRPDLRRMLIPLGPVAVFGASNFPLAFSTAGGDTAAALAAGCPVVVKGHPAHPLTGAVVADQITAAVDALEMPSGTFGHALAAGFELGVQLVNDDRIEAVAFTGSTAGGLAVAAAASARPRPIPVFAEMGSVNPLIVTGSAAVTRGDEIAAGIAAAVATFGGQLCTKPGIILIEAGPAGRQLATTVAEALAQRPPETLLTGAIAATYARGISTLDECSGVECLTPRSTLDSPAGSSGAPMAYVAPVALLAEHEALGEEHFGPAVVFLTYDTREDVEEALRRLGGQLTVSLHAGREEHRDLRWLVDLATSLSGRVVFDGYPTGVSVSWAMQHGGPFPATTDSRGTSVGMTAIRRFLRPVTYQNFPAALLPTELQDDNPRQLTRRIDGVLEPAR